MRNSTAPSHRFNTPVWKTPAPYILGAAGSVIALIVFAFFLLVCSCWRDSVGHSEENNVMARNGAESNIECGEMNETVVVIMAGEEKPTFIAKTEKCPS